MEKIYIKPEYLHEILNNPKFCYLYALNWIQEPFPEGETTIAISGAWSYKYAVNVLKARFPEGEKAIKRSPYRDLYRKRFNISDF